jgi:hypothetical protein
MYQIPKDVDWSFLCGKELIQVCYGRYQTQLHFYGDVSVSIEANVEHSDGSQVLGKSLEREQCVTSLINLLGASIKRVELEGDDALALHFSNDNVLRLLVDDAPYQAFSISAPGERTIIV